MKNNYTLPIVIVIVLLFCLCLILTLGGISFGLYEFGKRLPTLESFPPIDITPTPFVFTQLPIDEDTFSTLLMLEQTIVPQRDLALLACRFNNVCNVPETIEPPAIPHTVGTKRQFWLSNSDTGVYSQITATLQYLTEHAYFWVEDGVSYNPAEAEILIETFETEIYPTNRAFFGSEWTPGVDNDPHIYIIYAENLGEFVAGYYVSIDEYNPLIVEHSNAIEAFYIDSSQDLGDEYAYSTLAHEFQHMIHWYQDSNESSFLDEGFAELASFLNGYTLGIPDWVYTSDPDIPLTDWRDSGENSAHYGANFLFVAYFLDRFGDLATQALIHDQQNELDSVDNTLQQLGIMDPLTGLPIGADDFFLDWAVANYVHDDTVADGRYFYHNYSSSPTTSDTEWISSCPQAGLTRTVNQYGVDYIRIICTGDYTIHFSGATQIPLMPIDPHSGDYAFWSHKSNDSNTALTRQFDLTGVTGPVTFSYWTWYDLEPTYDYVYLEASADGETWDILITPSGTADDPTESAYGWGYTGASSGWVHETIDLSRYAGQMITLRFDYITDAAVVNNGFLVDDITIPEIGYSEDFENGTSDWEAAGFVLIQNALPQTFRLALIHHIGGEMQVDILPTTTNSSIEIPVSLVSGDDVVLVVTATTRFTSELAPYQIEIR